MKKNISSAKNIFKLMIMLALFIGNAMSVNPAGAIVGVDLSLTSSGSPTPTVIAGSSLSYSVTATNTGAGTAVNVSLTNTLPNGTTFVSLLPAAGWICATPPVASTGQINCSKASMGVESGSFTITVMVDANVSPSTIISNTFNISSDSTDTNPGNNMSITTTTVDTSADVGLTSSGAPNPVKAGNELSYSVTVSNSGPSDASTASWSNVLPAGETFVSISNVGDWFCNTPAVGAGGTVSCNIASLGVGGSQSFTLIVNVAEDVADSTIISSTSEAASTTSDATSGNNFSTAVNTVNTEADLSITQTDSPDPVFAGDKISYTITLNNSGPSAAASTTWSDTLPAGTTFAWVSEPAGWSCTSPAVGSTGTVSCNTSSMSVGRTDFALTVFVDSSTPAGSVISNSANVSSSTIDPTSGNNSISTTTSVAGRKTFTSQGINDGWILESSETSGKGGSLNSSAETFNLGDEATRKQYRAILSFQTSGLPATAHITKATLNLKKSGVVGGGNPISIFKGFVAEIKKGAFGPSPALTLADFQLPATVKISPLSTSTSGSWYFINLTPASGQIAGASLIQIRLSFKLDDNNNAIANYLKLYSGNAAAANRPQLILEYYIP